jgi:2-polyprenyl-6-hydroxyphenyl methylase / 3-demethylubiquinone-9 3-methyltransferase
MRAIATHRKSSKKDRAAAVAAARAAIHTLSALPSKGRIVAPSRSDHSTVDTVDAAEIARFARLAEDWWDAAGEFAALHRFNPTRLAYIRERLLKHFGRDARDLSPFRGLRLLDIGSGGGLVAEPMARLGFAVVGIDATLENVAASRRHAESAGLDIDYRFAAAEDLAAAGESFDAVLALEIVEHVADRDAFLAAAAALVRPGGAAIVATINRTQKAYFLAIIGAEYVLRWVAPGTHRWSKFVRPSELARGLRRAGLELGDITGMVYDPLRARWSLSRDLDVNYAVFAARPRGSA